MVKSKNDYDARKDDSRFAKFDKMLDPTYGQKQFYVLVIGLIILSSMLILTMVVPYFNASNETTKSLYDDGLNISYIPSEKLFHISFTNPHNDTLNFVSHIKVPFDSQNSAMPYLSVYEYSTTKFPVNITYVPSTNLMNVNHITIVTLIKENGNYTYAYTIIPETENNLWQGTGKYIEQIQGVFNRS
jgi:hypothetical protein